MSNFSSPKSRFQQATNRNRLLVTDSEQLTLRRAVVGFFGLSVGSHAATTWAMLARPNAIKIADPDVIDATNLNRIRVGWSQVGKRKVDAVSALLADMHPQMTVGALTDTSPASMEAYCRKKPAVSCIVDEIDDIGGKITLRQIARKMRIPLISAVDVGENVLLDVERYDRNADQRMFLGRLPGIETINVAALDKNERARLIIALVGLAHNSDAMLTSLLEIGKSIDTWPQLGSTATIAGGVIATTVKRVLLGDRVPSGRYVFEMDALLGKIPTTSERRHTRTLMSAVKRQFGV